MIAESISESILPSFNSLESSSYIFFQVSKFSFLFFFKSERGFSSPDILNRESTSDFSKTSTYWSYQESIFELTTSKTACAKETSLSFGMVSVYVSPSCVIFWSLQATSNPARTELDKVLEDLMLSSFSPVFGTEIQFFIPKSEADIPEILKILAKFKYIWLSTIRIKSFNE